MVAANVCDPDTLPDRIPNFTQFKIWTLACRVIGLFQRRASISTKFTLHNFVFGYLFPFNLPSSFNESKFYKWQCWQKKSAKEIQTTQIIQKIDKSWIDTHTYHWLYHFSYDSLTHLLSWRWVSLYSVYVKLLSSQPVRWSRTTEGVYFSQREREKNQNCQIEADRIEESSNGREKGRFGSLKRTHFQGPGVLDSDQSNCYLKNKKNVLDI